MSAACVSSRGLTNRSQATLVAISVLVFIGSLTSCRSKLNPVGATRSGIDAEAKLEAEKYWGSLLTKCGGTIYGKDNRQAVDQIYEFRDTSIRIKPRVLSD